MATGTSRVEIQIAAESAALDAQLREALFKVDKFANAVRQKTGGAGPGGGGGINVFEGGGLQLPRGLAGLSQGYIGVRAVTAGLDLAAAATEALHGNLDATVKSLEKMPLGIGRMVTGMKDFLGVVTGIGPEIELLNASVKQQEQQWKLVTEAVRGAELAAKEFGEQESKNLRAAATASEEDPIKRRAMQAEDAAKAEMDAIEKKRKADLGELQLKQNLITDIKASAVTASDPRVRAIVPDNTSGAIGAFIHARVEAAAIEKFQQIDDSSAKQTVSNSLAAEKKRINDAAELDKASAAEKALAEKKRIELDAAKESANRASGFNFEAQQARLKGEGDETGAQMAEIAKRRADRLEKATSTEERAAIDHEASEARRAALVEEENKIDEAAARAQEKEDSKRLEVLDHAKERISRSENIISGRRLEAEDAGFLTRGVEHDNPLLDKTNDLVELQKQATLYLQQIATDRANAAKLQMVGFN